MASPNVAVVIRSLNRVTAKVVRGLTLEITANLKAPASEGGTPVDTGWARANWVPSVGSSFVGTAGTRKQAEGGNIDSSPQSAGEVRVALYKAGQGSTFITNNVDYIVDLNGGSSKKAPRGFVQVAIQKSISRFAGRSFS